MLVIDFSGDGNCFIDQLKRLCVNWIQETIKEMQHFDLVNINTKPSAMKQITTW